MHRKGHPAQVRHRLSIGGLVGQESVLRRERPSLKRGRQDYRDTEHVAFRGFHLVVSRAIHHAAEAAIGALAPRKRMIIGQLAEDRSSISARYPRAR